MTAKTRADIVWLAITVWPENAFGVGSAARMDRYPVMRGRRSRAQRALVLVESTVPGCRRFQMPRLRALLVVSRCRFRAGGLRRRGWRCRAFRERSPRGREVGRPSAGIRCGLLGARGRVVRRRR